MERAPQLGDLLVSVGIISRDQLAQALEHQKQYGGMLGQVLVKLGTCTDDDIRGALEAQQRRTPLAQRLAVIKGRQGATEVLPAASPEVAWRFFQLHEREMRRIAKDVQDVCQLLGGMGLQIDAARKTLAEQPASVEGVLRQIWEQLSVVVRELGYYSVELAPAALEEGSLLTILKQYAAHYHTCYGGNLEIGLRSDDLRMSNQTALGLFRALQSLMRGIGNSEADRNACIYLSVEGEQAVAVIEFERLRFSSGGMGDPVGELEEWIALLGGHTEREEHVDRIRITCRAPVGPVPPGPRAGTIVVS